MIKKTLLAFLLSVCSFCAFSQGLQNFDFYYGHPLVSLEAKEYYARQFDVNSNNKAYSILDSTFTNNDETRPFYIYLACRMLTEARGDLLAELNIICRQIAEIFPSSLVAVLYAGRNYINDNAKHFWAARMATEIRITCNADLMVCFKDSRSTSVKNCDPQYKNRLEVLYNLVRKDLNLFQQR